MSSSRAPARVCRRLAALAGATSPQRGRDRRDRDPGLRRGRRRLRPAGPPFPDTPAVDVYVDDPSGKVKGPGVHGRPVRRDVRLPVHAARHLRRLDAQGGRPASAKPVLTTDVAVAEGKAFTVAGVGRFADLGLKVFADDISAPPAGQAKVRVVQASVTAPVARRGRGRRPDRSRPACSSPPRPTTSEVKPGDWQLELHADRGRAPPRPTAPSAAARRTRCWCSTARRRPDHRPQGGRERRRGRAGGWGGHRRRRHQRRRHAVPLFVSAGAVLLAGHRGSRRGRCCGGGRAAPGEHEDRPAPGAAIARHRWGWPVPARKAVTVGLTVTASRRSSVAGTTLGLRDHRRQAATGRAALARRDRRRDAGGAAGARRLRPRSRRPGYACPSSASTPRSSACGSARTARSRRRRTTTGRLVRPGHRPRRGRPGRDRRPRRLAATAPRCSTASSNCARATGSRCGATACGCRSWWSPPAAYPKDKFPTAEVYGPTPTAELRLITCGGTFDRHRQVLPRQRGGLRRRRPAAGAAQLEGQRRARLPLARPLSPTAELDR